LDVEKMVDIITRWIKEQVEKSNGKGVVFGLSGGLDSAVTAALCRRVFPSEKCLGIYMPCYSDIQDRGDALLLAETLEVSWLEIPLEETFSSLMRALEGVKVEGNQKLAVANLKPRLRMITLYYLAAVRSFRVVGTSNRSEIEIGYFTKHGDGAADLFPLANVLKKETREIARFLKVPENIINKKPSGGLWEGQTDENELGFNYDQLDQYLEGGELEPSLQMKIDKLIQGSHHKKIMPPKLTFNRDKGEGNE